MSAHPVGPALMACVIANPDSMERTAQLPLVPTNAREMASATKCAACAMRDSLDTIALFFVALTIAQTTVTATTARATVRWALAVETVLWVPARTTAMDTVAVWTTTVLATMDGRALTAL